MTNNLGDRYLRQIHAFPEARRQASSIAIFGAEANPVAGFSLVAGAAAMGVPAVGSDYHGPEEADHWLTGNFADLAGQINPEVSYEYIDPAVPGADLPFLIEGRRNSCAVVLLNDVVHARHVLDAMVAATVDLPMILALAAPAGVVVERCDAPSIALERIRHLAADLIPAGRPELGIVAAGLVLNELMFDTVCPDVDVPLHGIVGGYSLRRPRRIPRGIHAERDLIIEISSNPGRPVSTFAGRRFVMIGAGALANWSAIPIALESPGSLVIFDGDPAVEIHNINRQILLVKGMGTPRPKVEVLAAELNTLDPDGSYEGIVKFIGRPEDLPHLDAMEGLICVPDNNKTRFVCDEARRGADVLFATGGSSAVGGQAILSRPGEACLRCLGLLEDSSNGNGNATSQSCSLVQNDAVVSSNMVIAGLMISELREALSGRPTANVRFVGDARRTNHLARMISKPKCPHGTVLEVMTE